MTKVLGVEFAPLKIPVSRRLQTVAVIHYISVFVLIPILSIWFFVYVFLFTQYWWTVLLYAAWFYYDRDTPKRGGRQFGKYFFRNWAIWRWQRDYFPVTLHKTADLDPEKNYILGYHPHGIVSVGAYTNFGTEANGVTKMFPDIKIHLCTLVGNFWFPLRREYTMMSALIWFLYFLLAKTIFISN